MKSIVIKPALAVALALAWGSGLTGALAFADGGSITGTVKLDGPAPTPKKVEISKDKEVCGLAPHFDESLVVGADGGVQFAIVTIQNAPKTPVKPATDVKFDQKGCDYIPHVLAFPAGSTVQVTNSDGILHNIHTDSKVNAAVNFAQPKFKKVIQITEEKPELFKVNCDAHGWMHGWWYVADNPYYAVTDANGNFTINNVPPGDYTIQVWQEKLAPVGKEVTQKVSVKAGAPSSANVSLKQG
jgi:plastocyanin